MNVEDLKIVGHPKSKYSHIEVICYMGLARASERRKVLRKVVDKFTSLNALLDKKGRMVGLEITAIEWGRFRERLLKGKI